MLVKTATACRSFPFSMIVELLSQDQLLTSLFGEKGAKREVG